jgi:hypothetical protein
VAHPRKTIRARIKERLKAAATLAGDRVFSTMMPIASIDRVLSEEGPMIMAYVRSETKPVYQEGREDASVKHTLEIAIEALCIAKKGQSADDLVDDLSEQVEAALDAFTVPEYPSGQFILTETQIDVTDALESILAGAFLTYEFSYYAPSRADDGSGDFLPTDDPAVDAVINGDGPVIDWPPPTAPTAPGPGGTPHTPDPATTYDPNAPVHGLEVV